MEEQRMNDGVDAQLTRALERKPAVEVPAGFAARMAGRVPVRRTIAVPTARFGLLAARVGMAMLLLALVVLSMRSADRTVFGIAMEWILCAEVVGLAAWLSGAWKLMAS